MAIEISKKEARRIVSQTQLKMDFKSSDSKENTLHVITQLGYVQIDTISVVQRAHHHTLWSRIPEYHPNLLRELQNKDRRIFEYWGHAHSILPLEDYRFYLARMKSYFDPCGKWEKQRLEKYGHLMKPAIERIRQEGSLMSRDFSNSDVIKVEDGWNPKPIKAALEMLFWRGDLMIKERINNQRVYDLTERVLPDWVDVKIPGEKEIDEFLVLRALTANCIADRRDISDYIHLSNKSKIKDALDDMIEKDQVKRLKIDGISQVYYALSSAYSVISENETVLKEVFILSPFDNFVINRKKLNDLYNFNYTIECYVPEAKRKFGYFVLPIFFKDKFVGRMDPKCDRKKRILLIKNLVFEESFEPGDEFLMKFTQKLNSFLVFNGCHSLIFENVKPKKLKDFLNRSFS